MEHSTSAVNWQPRNIAKEPGQMLRNALQHVARGSDGVLFFQWRQSRAGAEKYHSGMVPHAGRDSQLFRDVVELGATLGRLAEVRGSQVEQARVALLWDTQAWWAAELEAHPTVDLRYLDLARRMHGALLDAGVAVDVLPAGSPLDGYDVVLVPTLYLAPQDLSDRLTDGRGPRRTGARLVLLGHRRRLRPGPPGRVPRGVPGPAGGARGGVRAPGGRGDHDAERREHRGGLDRADDVDRR